MNNVIQFIGVFFLTAFALAACLACAMFGGWVAAVVHDRFGRRGYYAFSAIVVFAICAFVAWRSVS